MNLLPVIVCVLASAAACAQQASVRSDAPAKRLIANVELVATPRPIDVVISATDHDTYLIENGTNRVLRIQSGDGVHFEVNLVHGNPMTVDDRMRPTYPFVRAVAAGDLDSDGLVDLAFADHSRKDTIVLLRRELGFERIATVVGLAPESLEIADIDGDGRNELIGSFWMDDSVVMVFTVQDKALRVHSQLRLPRDVKPRGAIAWREEPGVSRILVSDAHSGFLRRYRLDEQLAWANEGVVPGIELEGFHVFLSSPLRASNNRLECHALSLGDAQVLFSLGAEITAQRFSSRIPDFAYHLVIADVTGDLLPDAIRALNDRGSVAVRVGLEGGQFARDDIEIPNVIPGSWSVATARLPGEDVRSIVVSSFRMNQVAIVRIQR